MVDEIQTIAGIEFESILSEIEKNGASFLPATQRLGKLDVFSQTMIGTLLATFVCLAVFQVSGRDSRVLASELGRERIS